MVKWTKVYGVSICNGFMYACIEYPYDVDIIFGLYLQHNTTYICYIYIMTSININIYNIFVHFCIFCISEIYTHASHTDGPPHIACFLFTWSLLVPKNTMMNNVQ